MLFRKGAYTVRMASGLLVAVLLLAGCTVKFAPDYDKSIIDGLVKANTETMTLFAAVSEGVPGSTFSKREDSYNALIGQFDSLRAQATARPAPRSRVAEWLGIGATDAKIPADIARINRLQGPSAEILAEIVKVLSRTRNTDRKGTLDRNKVEGFLNAYNISFDQVLTYEKALER